MKKYLFLYSLLLTAVFSYAIYINAQEGPNFAAAMAELGCNNRESCEQKCNNPDMLKTCLDVAEKHKLQSQQEIDSSREIINKIEKGEIEIPEGLDCKNALSCETECGEAGLDKLDQCLAFAENILEEGGLPDNKRQELRGDLEMGRKFKKLKEEKLARGEELFCKNEFDCRDKCSQSAENMARCAQEFKEMIPAEEQAEMQKIEQYMRKGGTLPNCEPDMGRGPSKGSKKSKNSGRTPCSQWCAEPVNAPACFRMAKEMGDNDMPEDMTEEKFVKMMEITGGQRMDCEDPEDDEQAQKCEGMLEKMLEADLIPERDRRMIEEGRGKMMEALNSAPEEVQGCLREKLGGKYEGLKAGTAMPSRSIGESMGECFQQMGGPRSEGEFEEGEFGNGEGEEFRPGPGRENPGKRMMPQQAGPGGCKSPEECQNYCQENPEDCKNFGPKERIRPEEEGEFEDSEFGEKEGFSGPDECQNPEECRAKIEGQVRQQIQQRIQEGYGPQEGQQMPPEGFQRPPEQFEGQPPINQQGPPPPPPPPSSFIKPNEFLGSVLYVIAKALYGLTTAGK